VLAVLLPAGLLAVSVKVVVAVGNTMMFPEEPTGPTPLSIITEVAFDTFQLKLLEPPRLTLDGLAVKKLIMGRVAGVGAGVLTITCVVAGTLPAELVAVSV